ncbi:hypothetical protein SRO_0395 [Streptomyces rochei]|nr:hypothetical protein SRO_0395 [Streptomyces rochei]
METPVAAPDGEDDGGSGPSGPEGRDRDPGVRNEVSVHGEHPVTGPQTPGLGGRTGPDRVGGAGVVTAAGSGSAAWPGTKNAPDMSPEARGADRRFRNEHRARRTRAFRARPSWPNAGRPDRYLTETAYGRRPCRPRSGDDGVGRRLPGPWNDTRAGTTARARRRAKRESLVPLPHRGGRPDDGRSSGPAG